MRKRHWRDAVDYAFTRDLGRDHWAWEFLRRNPDYHSHWLWFSSTCLSDLLTEAKALRFSGYRRILLLHD